MRLRSGFLATVAALCIMAGAIEAQYVEDSIDVGGMCVGRLAYNSREDVLYGTSGEEGLFFAISCDSDKVVSSFQLEYAFVVAYESSDNKAYCSFTCLQADDSLLVVDGATHTRIKSIPMPGATLPVWDPVTDRMYVSCQTTDRVAVVDCAADSLLTYIAVGACPVSMYISTLRRKLYVLNLDDGSISIVNLTTNQVIKTVAVGGTPNAGYYCKSADKFYSAGTYGQCIAIDGFSDTIVAHIPLTGNAEVRCASGNEEDGLVYLSAFTSSGDYVATVSTQRDSVVATVVTGQRARDLDYSSGSRLLYCASDLTNEVFVVTSDGTRRLTTLQVGDYPEEFALVPRHNRLYLGHWWSRYVYVLRDTSAAIAEPQLPRLGFGEALRVTPNPFTHSVAVSWNPPIRNGHVARLYAQDGRLVRQAPIPAGEAPWVWDGRDDSGVLFPPGVYILETGSGVRAKVVKLK
jgi:YVTN family beta-propeller protein